LVQQYVNHGGVIFKVYVLGDLDEVHVVPKPSLPDLHQGAPPYWLNSQDMVLRPLLPEGEGSETNGKPNSTTPSAAPPTAAQLRVSPAVVAVARACAEQLRKHVLLTLFGFDLLDSGAASAPATAATDAASTTGAAAVPAHSSWAANGASTSASAAASARFQLIDINYFPSYKTVSNLRDKLLRVCLRVHREQTQQQQQQQQPQQCRQEQTILLPPAAVANAQ
jgi:hypothetical protein